MQISFQHVNPRVGHESTLLHVTPEADPPSTYLLDAGESVSPASFLGEDQSLDGIFLTHAHSDHYESLGAVLSTAGDCPLYTSPGTAAIFEQVYSEAAQHRDLESIDRVMEALTPVENWTQLSEYVDVCPVPAGHAPGAVGFLFRVDDLKRNDETVMILATGDFTTHPVAGYPELRLPGDVHVDIMFANAATTDEFTGQFTAALEAMLEHALGGATTLVGSDALASVHTAYALGRFVGELGREVPVRLVGQAAKLYVELDYDVPSVTPHPSFDDPDEVLSRGGITVAGPAEPTQGSTERLFERIADDSSAAFVQLTASEGVSVNGNGCTTAHYGYSPHPTDEQFEAFVADHLPRHLVLKHTSVEAAKSLGDSFEEFFHWANDDTHEHLLYDDGSWVAPEWVSNSQADRIRMKTYRSSNPRMPLDQPRNDLPTVSLARGGPDLAAEGIAVSEIVEKFDVTDVERATPAAGAADSVPEAADSVPEAADSVPEAADSVPEATDSVPEAATRTVDVEAIVSELGEEIRGELESLEQIQDRLESVESRLDAFEGQPVTEGTVTDQFETVTARLDGLDQTVSELSTQVDHSTAPSVPGTVVRNGELVLLQVETGTLAESELSLEHGQEVQVRIGPADD